MARWLHATRTERLTSKSQRGLHGRPAHSGGSFRVRYRVGMIWLACAAVWLVVISVRFVAVKVRKRARRHVVRERMAAEAGPNVLHGPLMGVRRRCRRCWWRLARERGHMLAWSEGGADENHNFVPLCHVCNQGQGARTPWWQWLRILTPWVGWRFPVPTPLMVVVAVWVFLR